MSICPNCGTHNRSNARFCRTCRSDLSVITQIVCSRCGATLRPTARFCKSCGNSISGPAPSRSLCPRCGASIRPGARFCAKCCTPIGAQTGLPTGPPTGPHCPHCGTAMRVGARFCRFCSHPLTANPLPPPPPPSPADLPGRYGTGELLPTARLAQGRYIILVKIAQGGMGAIYQAQDRRLQDKIVAVKEMSESAVAPGERDRILECFKREAELLARLEHPNLVRVSDLFQEGERHYMVMEYVQGQTLEKMLEGTSRPFPEDQVLTWAEQLCDVLSYLHNQKPQIVYRDMKPANVMIMDGSDVVKLIDFGIARFFKPGKRKDTIELGTDGYAPPEQYGKSQTDERADVYALGAMLHQLLTLRDPVTVPFQFPSVRSLNSRVSRSVDTAIEKAVQSNKGKRFQSIDEMKRALVGDGRGEVKRRKPTQPTKRSKPARPTARKKASPVSRKLSVTPSALNFGSVPITGMAPKLSLKVDLPSRDQASLSTGAPWLHLRPRTLNTSGEVTVQVYPRRLKHSKQMLKGLGWLAWPARFLVPAPCTSSDQITVSSKSGTVQVPVHAIATPAQSRVVAGWVGTILLMLAMLSIVGSVLLLILAALGVVM
jgi:serine/threonine protein kinase/ribosomal protein L40E